MDNVVCSPVRRSQHYNSAGVVVAEVVADVVEVQIAVAVQTVVDNLAVVIDKFELKVADYLAFGDDVVEVGSVEEA